MRGSAMRGYAMRGSATKLGCGQAATRSAPMTKTRMTTMSLGGDARMGPHSPAASWQTRLIVSNDRYSSIADEQTKHLSDPPSLQGWRTHANLVLPCS